MHSSPPVAPVPGGEPPPDMVLVGYSLDATYTRSSAFYGGSRVYDDRTLLSVAVSRAELVEHSERLHAWALERLRADGARDGIYEAQFRLLHPSADPNLPPTEVEEEDEDDDYTPLRSEYIYWDGVGESSLTPWIAPELTQA